MKNKTQKMNKSYKFLLLFSLLLILIFKPLSGAVMDAGEELEYKVSFLGIRIGTIKMTIIGQEKIADKTVWRTKAYIDSREGIPYVALHAIYESWVDQSISYSNQFVGNTKFMSYDWVFQKILFNYPDNEFYNESWYQGQIKYKETVKTKKRWNDGSSIFYLARQYVDSKKNLVVPTIIERDTSTTILYLQGKREKVEIDAADYPLKSIYFTGKGNWKGLYGLSGNFEGWFSDDDAHVPLKAKLNVLVGAVTVELVKWRRNNWSLPRAN
ncbi:MAG: DUF3108 domain-containing protein [Candidatus Kapabacteria bacterium]|nr:DUF3108 domain-containing protein [Candidatus Kapabacteria bacterium]